MSASKNLIQAAAGAGGGAFYGYTIDNSARFNDNDSAYLYRTPSSASNRKTYTFSCWVKRGNLGSTQEMFNAGQSGANPRSEFRFHSTDQIRVGFNPTGSTWYESTTDAYFRDVSAWYHVVLSVDMTQATSTDRMKLYVNGVQQTFSVYSVPAQNTDTVINSTTTNYIGVYGGGGATSSFFDGYMAEAHFVDGSALDATSFGETKNGAWISKSPSVTYGTNGFYLDFASSSALGNDVSGNNNDFTSSGLTSSDQMTDTPTSNFATLNPLASSARTTLSDGNLVSFGNSSLEDSVDYSTIAVTSGKWYWEEKINAISSAASYPCVGVARIIQQPSNGKYTGDSIGGGVGYFRTGTVEKEGSSVATYATFTTNDVIGVALDVDNLEIKFYKNGTLQGTVTGLTSSIYYMSNTNYYNSQTTSNFGQSSFAYTPPTGFVALSTANLPEPTIGPNIDSDDTAGLPEEQFSILLYEGNSTNDRDITGVGFDPDLGWFKNRDEAYGWIIVDRNRGDGWSLGFDTGGQESGTGKFDSFITDGYRIDSHPGLNRSSIVNWSWKAGGTASSNTDGTITSSVSANTDAGISIIKANIGTSGNVTVGHGLGVSPGFVMAKGISAGSWNALVPSVMTKDQYIFPNLNNAIASYTDYWGSALPTSTVIGLQAGIGFSNDTIIYAFAEVEGFSKFGKYTGNGSTDGPFVYTGMRPAFVIIKRTDAANDWYIYDTARDTYNAVDHTLYPNLSNAESAATEILDVLSNGFKIRLTSTAFNGSGGTYIYMAFAENPFKYSNAR